MSSQSRHEGRVWRCVRRGGCVGGVGGVRSVGGGGYEGTAQKHCPATTKKGNKT